MKIFDRALLADSLDKRAQADLKNNDISGASIVVCQNGEIVYKNFFGDVVENTLFRIASMTKPITAVAMMILAERGLICLEDRVEKYLPEYSDMHIAGIDADGKLYDAGPAKEKVRIFHLLSHTSGIGSGDAALLQYEQMTDEDKRTLENMVSYHAKCGLSFEPFTKEEYSGRAAFDLLALIAEKVTGKNYSDFLREEIFIPCQMKDTGFVPTDDQWSRMAIMHDKVDGKAVEAWTMENCVFEEYPCTHFMGGAGLFSSLDDYLNFAQMLLNKGVFNGKRIISEESVKRLKTPIVPESVQPGNQRWSLGMRVVVKEEYAEGLQVGTYGWSGAYGSHFWIDDANQVTAVYMKNSRFDGGDRARTILNFEKDVSSALV